MKNLEVNPIGKIMNGEDGTMVHISRYFLSISQPFKLWRVSVICR